MTGNADIGSVERVARCAGEAVPEDFGDEHQRWAVYQAAIRSGACRDELLRAVSLDPDPVLALSVALRMLESEGAQSREDWVAALPGGREREYAKRRAAEIKILEAHGDVDGLSRETVEAWSDWLQIRLAETSRVHEVLDHLARYGRTKKIRRSAAAQPRRR